MGRPSLYTPELIEVIAERLSNGEPMAVICRDEGMPAYRTVKDWMESMPEVSAAIARAREEGFDVLAAQCLEIADTPEEGVETTERGDSIETRHGDMLGHRKLRIETRMKLLAKWDPKRWGERIGLVHDLADNLADQMKAARERAANR
jgi:hypothetical protein